MDRIIVTTYDELKSMLTEILEGYLSAKKEEPILSERMSLDEALHFLKSSGYPTSKAKIYQLTSKNKMPYGKYGNKLSFSRKELQEWAPKQIIRMNNNSDDIAAIAANARRRQK